MFTYNAGFPDTPKLARRSRHRHIEDLPRIETVAWVQAMSRRIEASVSRDRIFGVVTWNCVFRSSVNLSHSLDAYETKEPASQEHTFTPQSLEKGCYRNSKHFMG